VIVIPSEVENGAAGEAATWTGRPELGERELSEFKSRRETEELLPGDPSTPLRFAQDDRTVNRGEFV